MQLHARRASSLRDDVPHMRDETAHIWGTQILGGHPDSLGQLARASPGRTREKVVPRRAPPVLERTWMQPPFFSMSCLQTQRPRPVPTVPLVVKKGSKTCLMVAG